MSLGTLEVWYFEDEDGGGYLDGYGAVLLDDGGLLLEALPDSDEYEYWPAEWVDLEYIDEGWLALFDEDEGWEWFEVSFEGDLEDDEDDDEEEEEEADED